MAEMVEKSREPGTLEEAKWNTFNEQFMDKLSGFDDVGEAVKKFFKDDAVTDGKFILYRKDREIVFSNTYRKGGKRKLRKAYLYLKGGIPVKARKRGVVVKKKDFPLSGFSEVDRGIMTQTRKSFEKTLLKFVGKNKYKLLIYLRGRNPENLWVESIKR